VVKLAMAGMLSARIPLRTYGLEGRTSLTSRESARILFEFMALRGSTISELSRERRPPGNLSKRKPHLEGGANVLSYLDA